MRAVGEVDPDSHRPRHATLPGGLFELASVTSPCQLRHARHQRPRLPGHLRATRGGVGRDPGLLGGGDAVRRLRRLQGPFRDPRDHHRRRRRRPGRRIDRLRDRLLRAHRAPRTPRRARSTSRPSGSSAPSAGSRATARRRSRSRRILPLVRAYMSFPAGAARMRYGRFLAPERARRRAVDRLLGRARARARLDYHSVQNQPPLRRHRRRRPDRRRSSVPRIRWRYAPRRGQTAA